MKMGTEFWVGHVAAATRETISASEYARRHGISVAASIFQPINESEYLVRGGSVSWFSVSVHEWF